MFRLRRKKKSSGTILCCVHLPNDSSINLAIDEKARGLDLWRDVMASLSLPEQDFFGLKYAAPDKAWKRKSSRLTFRRASKKQNNGLRDVHTSLTWVQLNDKLSEQLGQPDPYLNEDLPPSVVRPDDLHGTWHVYMAVKFYVGPTITSWWSHASKELLFHQLRHDVACGLLEVPLDVGVKLGGYAMHVIEGDFDPGKHSGLDYLYAYHFLPKTDDDTLKAIQQEHRQCRGMITSADALTQFIDTCQHLEEYGVLMFHAFHNNTPIVAGVSPKGLYVYKDKRRLYSHPWHALRKLDYSGKKLHVVLLQREVQSATHPHITLVFSTQEACKAFWKAAIHHHTFFHRKTPSLKSLAVGSESAVTLHQAVHSARSNNKLLLKAGLSKETMHLPSVGHSQRPSHDASKASLASLIAGVQATPRPSNADKHNTWVRRAVMIGSSPDVIGGLSAERGEIVEIVDSSDHDWWLVKAAQDVGRVPARMVREFRCEPHHVVEALSDFASEELAFNKGDVLFILKEQPDKLVVTTGTAHGEVPAKVINFDFAKSRYYDEEEEEEEEVVEGDMDGSGISWKRTSRRSPSIL
ncbi:hypothetical protein PTSG_03219 [Salpingoeca rosetta]|uniref:FERM domain-containing protein n=1 Tax=Salpingoeca rosetta (strain ATCC 50818 / BSB-021) TaxID=946362 RepID=F2U4K1_SALR5|nr:uncharacterized protein PTSG_03219 [Salpingoeca rosetta]EGD82567.1 hypothetical protein PTSG_03219 [Salpingoeca rosetta]|eukprot:XP_004995803.1 hypothetical protein PTSG_03219 [Salpingoeca rosetta]